MYENHIGISKEKEKRECMNGLKTVSTVLDMCTHALSLHTHVGTYVCRL